MAQEKSGVDTTAALTELPSGVMLQIIQLTDCHLFADPEMPLRGIVTRRRFEQVLEEVGRQFPRADLLVLTGDTAHDEQRGTYEAVREALGAWEGRLRLIPGNHDDRPSLAAVFPGHYEPVEERLTFTCAANGWRVIGLDSQRPGEVPGSLEPRQLEWLDQRLSDARDVPTLLLVHHPPILVNSPWIDRLRLQDAHALGLVLSRHPQVRLVSCGHVHQEAWGSLGGVTVLTTPAVGPPFRARTAELEIDDRPPCYRLLELLEGGQWRTQVLECGERGTLA
jgi:3',5'-cyclic-AMP phosphodiesterase